MNDFELLRRYEPIVRFTQGELFFPCAVDGYVRECSLLPRTRTRGVAPLVPAGELDLDSLVRLGAADPERALNLRLVQEPLRGTAYRDWRRRADRPAFSATGRLARVGLAARLVDGLFALSLLLRGTVPGGTAAAAEQMYRAEFAQTPAYVYYGRVLRQNRYIVLNYLFFYFMDDWRSTFAGVNDHEADWEQIFVYLTVREDGSPEPAWVGYAAHDYHGDDMRRRWDDPELTIVDTHPVVFAGAGSHASYFQAGEYLTAVPLPYAQPLLAAIRVMRRIWRDVLRQGDEERWTAGIEALISIPFVDYARGDGRAIGPGQADEWAPVLVSEETAWIEHYRGLWGLDTRDPLSGELAPSGPKYQRDGTVRQTWYDPLGWAGLEKVPTSAEALGVVEQRIEELEREREETDLRLTELAANLARSELEVRALQPVRHLAALHKARQRELTAQEASHAALQAQRIEVLETLAACRRYRDRLKAGDAGDPQSHIRRKHAPQTPKMLRENRVAELWAGLSISLLLVGAVAVALFGRQNWLLLLLLLLTVVLIVENILHYSLGRLALNATILLALVSSAVLIYNFFWQLVLAIIVVIAVLIFRDNLRDIRGP